MEAKPRKKRDKNYEFQVVNYLFLALFLAMMVYFVYFQIFRSEQFINNPYNPLQSLFSEHVVRGEICASDGSVLARTTINEDGSETREYPYGSLFAHAVGYSTNGTTGLENQANFYLLRSHAFFAEQIANDIQGKKNQGDRVVTTLDYNLQKAAYDALGNYDGAVIVMEPATGKILAMVSKPDYDPNKIATNWEDINVEGSSVLVNRATQGKYAPGSVFKIFTTLEYYRENPYTYNSYQFDCKSEITIDGKSMHCAANQAHGEEDLKTSFANSCNCSYASLCLTLDKQQFAKTCQSLLFDTALPAAFESSASQFSLPEDASVPLMMETSIGQGNTLVSPLHMLLVSSAVCNDGILMTPYLIDHIENNNGSVIESMSAKAYGTLLTEEESTLLQEYMKETVLSGTGQKLSGASYEAAGKTGTAQVSDSSDRTNSWFTGYAHQEGKNDIAIAVIIEDSDTKNANALPVTRAVLDAYFH